MIAREFVADIYAVVIAETVVLVRFFLRGLVDFGIARELIAYLYSEVIAVDDGDRARGSVGVRVWVNVDGRAVKMTGRGSSR